MGAVLLHDERSISEREAYQGNKLHHRCITPCNSGTAVALLLFIFSSFFYEYVPPELWVKIYGVEGLDRSTDAVTAPTFNIILRVNYEDLAIHPRNLCGKGGSVVVAYAGVPLARGDLPDFCVTRGVVSSVPVVTTSEGLGLPDELYERMDRRASDSGTNACRWRCTCG